MHTKGVTHIPPKPDDSSQNASGPGDKFDDEDYPAYSMGRAAELLGVTQAFLRSLDTANLITPLRSEGGHRRYSRYQLRVAARARELIDQGTPTEAACRIITLEDQLSDAQRINTELRQAQQQQASEAIDRESTTD
ncbi:HTH merR-type domain-containing protein [Prescottella defluvii]|uniref:helix-turn-helix domain-containing protein n=1 Tax=Prescottella defluvii TaxID=1323361 RepID=UPI0004F39C06